MATSHTDEDFHSWLANVHASVLATLAIIESAPHFAESGLKAVLPATKNEGTPSAASKEEQSVTRKDKKHETTLSTESEMKFTRVTSHESAMPAASQEGDANEGRLDSMIANDGKPLEKGDTKDLRPQVSQQKTAASVGTTSAMTKGMLSHGLAMSNQPTSWNLARCQEPSGGVVSWNLARCQESDDVGADTWNFRQSCWDACAFLGDSNVMMTGESVIIILMLLINVCMQGGLIIIVAFSLSGTSLDEDTIDGYHWWRTNVGHSITFTDLMSEKSLASRVCAGDTSLHLSDMQTQQVNDINAYLYENSPFNGPLMCSLALLTWVLTVSKELHALKQMVRALTIIERGATQIIIDRTHFPAGLKLTRLSAARLYWILFLCIPRAGIACSLLVFGAKYLAVTISIEDILLNAVALEFVMNVDELLYAALAPIKTRTFTIKMKPLPLGNSPACSGVDRNVLIAALAVFGFFGAALPLWLVPEFDRMKQVKDELCGGLQEFSYTYSSGGFIAWAKEQKAADNVLDELRGSSRYKIIRNVIKENPIEIATMAKLDSLRGPGWSVFSVDAWRVDEIGKQINPFCLDMLNSTTMRHVNVSAVRDQLAIVAETALRDSLGNQSITSCDDVVHACQLYTHIGATARAMCSLTCGCAVPQSGLLLPWAPEGCPSSCMARQYQQQIDAAPCVDTPINHPIFQGIVTSLKLIPGFEQVVEAYEAYGCAGPYAIDQAHGTNFCHIKATFTAMALICPQSCMCKLKPNAYGCPKTC